MLTHFLYQQLFNFREEFAQEADRSPTSLISDKDLFSISKARPSTKS